MPVDPMTNVATQINSQGRQGGVRLRQGVCTSVAFSSDGIHEITATVNDDSVPGIRCTSNFAPGIGQGVWLLVSRRGRWLCIAGSSPTPWINATLLNGWGPALGWQAVQYRRVGDMVHLRGSCGNNPNPPYANPVINLPVGFRPPAMLSMPTEGAALFKWILFDPNGNVNWYCPSGELSDPNRGSSLHFNHQFSVTP